MMKAKEVPAYAYRDFWSRKPRFLRPFYRLLSYIIAPIAACVFTNADCIAVYHDMRVVGTLKKTVQALADGARIVIFPEHDEPCNDILYAFQDRFVDAARMYHLRYGGSVEFAPVYVAARLRRLVIGRPVRFDPGAPIEEERRRICAYLTEEITAMARALPRHTVVPYPNIPKKLYPENLPPEVSER